MPNKYNFPFTKPPQIDAPWTNAHSLGQKIETVFTRFIQRVISWGYEFFSELLVDIFDASMKIMRPGLSRVTDPIIQTYLRDMDLPDYMRSSLQAALDEKGESSFLIKLAVFYTSIFGTLTGGLGPVRRLAEYGADKTARSFLPNISELARLNFIGLVSDQKYIENAAKLGLAEPLIPVYKELVRNLPSMGELFNGFWRGIYSLDDFKASLKRMGYNEKDIALFIELSKNLPPVQDLIRMLVRDAFNDTAASTYGYDEDYPDAINEFFSKQGYDPSWAKKYWRAHWTLPSPTQAYEMLHRGLIDQGDMETLLRISDYPKFWRDKLIGTSYHVYTRVDIRRLFQAGLLDESQVKTAYLEAGYNEEKADILAKFAIMGASDKEKDPTRSDILNMYEDNLLDRSEAEQALIKMGYDQKEADQYMDMADFNIAKATRVDNIHYVQEQFLAGLIDKTKITTSLTEIGLTQVQIDRYVLAWERAIKSKVQLPSKADVLKFYTAELIDETKARDYLSKLGYQSDVIDLYMRSVSGEEQ